MESSLNFYGQHFTTETEDITPDSVTDDGSTEDIDENLSNVSAGLSDGQTRLAVPILHSSICSSMAILNGLPSSQTISHASKEKADDLKWTTVKICVGFDVTRKGERSLVIDGYKFTKSRDGLGNRVFWRCSRRECKATAVTVADRVEHIRTTHSHPPPVAAEFFSENRVRFEQEVRFSVGSVQRTRIRRQSYPNRPPTIHSAVTKATTLDQNSIHPSTNVLVDQIASPTANAERNSTREPFERISPGSSPMHTVTSSFDTINTDALTALLNRLVETKSTICLQGSHEASSSSSATAAVNQHNICQPERPEEIVYKPSSNGVQHESMYPDIDNSHLAPFHHPSERSLISDPHKSHPSFSLYKSSAPSGLEQLAAVATSFDTHLPQELDKSPVQSVELKCPSVTMSSSWAVPLTELSTVYSSTNASAAPVPTVGTSLSCQSFAISTNAVGLIAKNAQGQLVILSGDQLNRIIRINQSDDAARVTQTSLLPTAGLNLTNNNPETICISSTTTGEVNSSLGMPVLIPSVAPSTVRRQLEPISHPLTEADISIPPIASIVTERSAFYSNGHGFIAPANQKHTYVFTQPYSSVPVMSPSLNTVAPTHVSSSHLPNGHLIQRLPCLEHVIPEPSSHCTTEISYRRNPPTDVLLKTGNVASHFVTTSAIPSLQPVCSSSWHNNVFVTNLDSSNRTISIASESVPVSDRPISTVDSTVTTAPNLIVHWKKEKMRESVEEEEEEDCDEDYDMDENVPITCDIVDGCEAHLSSVPTKENHTNRNCFSENLDTAISYNGSRYLLGRKRRVSESSLAREIRSGKSMHRCCQVSCQPRLATDTGGTSGCAPSYTCAYSGGPHFECHQLNGLPYALDDDDNGLCNQVQDNILVKVLNTVQQLTAKLDADADPPEVILNCHAIQACLDTIAAIKRVRCLPSVPSSSSHRIDYDVMRTSIANRRSESMPTTSINSVSEIRDHRMQSNNNAHILTPTDEISDSVKQQRCLRDHHIRLSV